MAEAATTQPPIRTALWVGARLAYVCWYESWMRGLKRRIPKQHIVLPAHDHPEVWEMRHERRQIGLPLIQFLVAVLRVEEAGTGERDFSALNDIYLGPLDIRPDKVNAF